MLAFNQTLSRNNSQRAASMFRVPFSYSAQRTGDPKCTSSDACFWVSPAVVRASNTSFLDGIQKLNCFSYWKISGQRGNGGDAFCVVGNTLNTHKPFVGTCGDSIVTRPRTSGDGCDLKFDDVLHGLLRLVDLFIIYALRNKSITICRNRCKRHNAM